MRAPKLLGSVLSLTIAVSVSACGATAQDRVRGPELFGEGIFSTGLYELPPTFTPDGTTAYFTVSTPAYGRLHVIMESELRDGRWSEPRVASFSGRHGDADPLISPDGSRLFFISKRPLTPGGAPRSDFDIFYVEREDAGWGEPVHVAAASGPASEFYASVAADGTLYIAAVRPDSHGRGDIYRVPLVNGEYGEPEGLGPAINSPEHHDTTPFVAPDQSYLVFASSDRPDGLGAADLYISFRQADGSWSQARNLGPVVNSTRSDYCPTVSPDGRYLYFASERGFADAPLADGLGTAELMARLISPGNGLGDTYRIDMSSVLQAAGLRAGEQTSPPATASPAAQPVSSGPLVPLVDHHEHLASRAAVQLLGERPVLAEQLVAELDAAGIRRAVVLSVAYWFGSPKFQPMEDEYEKVRAENDWTAHQAVRFPDRLVAFCSFNPLKAYALEELRRCAEHPRLKGLKLHFGSSRVDVRNPEHLEQVRRVFREANALGMPIVAHLWTGPAFETEGGEHAEIFLSRILPQAPDVTVQIAHMAGGGRSTDAALKVFADAIAAGDPRTRNLYFDVTTLTQGQSDEGLRRDALRMRQIGLGRILWGSDIGNWGAHPYPPSGAAWQVFRMRVPLTDEELQIVAGNVPPYLR